MFRGLAGENGLAISTGFNAALRPIELAALIFSVALIYLPAFAKIVSFRTSVIEKPPFMLALIFWVLSLWVMQGRTVIPFLYFQF
jgi:alginate O-acetyltransferase complex protein AlgI